MTRSTLFNRAQGRFHPIYLTWLVIMWVLLMGEISLANVVGGLLVGLAVTVFLPLPAMPVSDLSISWTKLCKFLVVFSWDFLLASIKVSWLAVRRTKPPRTAIIQVPMRVESEFVLSLAVLLYNLEPGGAVTDIDIAERMLTIHILDGDQDTDIQREVDTVGRLERYLIDIFERSV